MKVCSVKKWKVIEDFIRRDEMGRYCGRAGRFDSLIVSSDNTK